MIHAHRPKRFQQIYCVNSNFNLNRSQTTTLKGCLLLFFDESRMIRLRAAVESEGLSIENFVAQALETYCYSIEQSYANPQFPKSYTAPLEDN